MKRKLLVFFLLIFIFFNKGFAQNVSIDFSGKADTTVTLEDYERISANCNGATSNCIVFTIKLNANADLLNFEIKNPAPPGNAAFYTLNCDGIQRSLGTPICITGNSTVTITYCKTGNDRPDYIFTSSTAVKASADLNLRQLCTGAMSVTGLLSATVTWTSIFPGTPGQYDGYLSSPTGSLTTNVTPAVGAPATILYKVSGNTNCTANRSDTVRVNTYAPLTVALTPTNPVICATGGSITLTATPSGGNAPYTYLWSNGATTPSITVSAVGTYTVNVSDNTSGCGPIPQSVTVTAAPTPATPTASGATICAGSTATVTATAPGGTYQWYSAASGGTPLFTGTSYTTSVLSTTTTYYVEVTSAAGCTSSRTAVTVTVNPIPIVPTAAPVSTCSGSSATLSASSPSGGIYAWYDSASGGNLIATGATFTTPALTANAIYYVQTTVNGCTSTRAAVNVTVNATPVAPTANGATICNGTAASLSVTTVSGATYEWYDATAGGNLLITGSTYTTPILGATTTYYVQATINGCSGPRTAVTVTVAPIPTAPTSVGATICSGSTTTLTATAPGGGTFAWYNSASGGTLLSSSTNFTTPVVTANTTYYVQTIVNGCVSARTAVTVTVNPLPAAPTASGATVCEGDGTTLTAANVPGETYRWYSSASGGTLLFTGNAYTTPLLSTTTIYYVDATSASGCTGPRRAVTVTVIARVNPAFTYTSGTFCKTGLNPTPNFVASSGGTFAGSAGLTINSSTGEIDLASTPIGTYDITFTVTTSSCTYSSTQKITITNTPNATFSYTGPYCQFQTNPLPTFPAGASAGVFSAVPAGLVFLNPGTGEIDLQSSLPGIYTVTNNIAASGGCAATSATNTVTINPTPAINSAASSVICNNTSPNYTITLQSNISGVTFSWSRAAIASINNGSGISGQTGSTINETLINTTNASIDVVYTIIPSANGCSGTPFTYTVTVNPTLNIISNAGTIVCNNTALNYAIQSNVSGATFSWSRAAVTGISNGTISGQTSNTITETLINTSNAPIDVIYTIVPSINGCNGASFTYTVTVNPTLVINSSANGVICSNTAQNYNIQSNVSSAIFSWSRAFVAGISNGAVAGQTSTTITETLINTTGTPINVVYTIVPSVNGCDGAAFTYTVTVNPTAAITNTSLSQTVCSQSSSVAVAFTFNIPGATAQWTATASSNISGFAASGTGDILSQTLVNTGSTAETIDYLVTPYLNGCPGIPVHYIITVNPKPVTPVLTSNSPVCQDYALTLTTPTIPGASYLWTGPNGFTSAQQNPVINSTQLSAAGLYSLVITVNGCSSDAGTVNVTVLPTPVAPVASNNGPLCAGNTLLLTANTIAGATYNWTGPNGFTSSLQNPSITNITPAGGGVYSVTVTVNGCTSVAGTTTVIVTAIPVAPVVTTNGPVCEGSTINLSVNNIPGTTYTWTGPNGFTSNLPNPTIPSASQANAGVYSVTATVNGCTGPSASVIVNVNQTPVNPVASSNSDVCSGSPIILGVSTFAGAIYHWTGPNGFSSNLQNPIITNASVANSGTYTVSITAPGCSVTISTSTIVVVKQTPVAPTASSNSPVCIGDNLNLAASNVAGAIYSWVGPNGFTSGLRNPVINNTSAAASGAYSVIVTVDGCTSAATTTNVVISVPKIAFAGNNQVVCANNPIVTLAGTITNDNTGIWASSGTGTFSPSNTSLSATYTPSVADIAAGNITLTLSSVNNGGCGTSSSSIQITITPTPIVNTGGNKSICDNDPFANLTGSVTYASGGKWTTSGTGTFSPSANAITVNYIPSDADKKIGSVKLTLTSVGNNCLAVSDVMTLSIIPSPTISMPDTKYILQGESAVLSPVVNGSDLQYSWSPASNLSSATIRNPVVTGVTSQLYTLSVTGTSGCIVQKQIMVTVLKPIVVPNTFTPNGDGINDRWVIKELENYPGAQLSLFNRYGTILYHTKGDYVPWDGNYNGQPVPFGTYYYLIDLGKYGQRLSGYIVVLR